MALADLSVLHKYKATPFARNVIQVTLDHASCKTTTFRAFLAQGRQERASARTRSRTWAVLGVERSHQQGQRLWPGWLWRSRSDATGAQSCIRVGYRADSGWRNPGSSVQPAQLRKPCTPRSLSDGSQQHPGCRASFLLSSRPLLQGTRIHRPGDGIPALPRLQHGESA